MSAPTQTTTHPTDPTSRTPDGRPAHPTSSAGGDVPHLPAAKAGTAPITGIPLSRLVRVELRKQLDTLSGRWIMGSIALAIAAVVTLTLLNATEHTYMTYVTAAMIPMSILLPIIGIMGATSEWSQRTAMTTFALEPRRGRVIAAKVLSALLLGAGAFLICLGLGAVGNELAILTQGATPDWSISWWLVGGAAIIVAFYVLQGSAYGLAFLNTPAAIVTYLVLPMVWSMLTTFVAAMADLGEWLDPNRTVAPLTQGLAPTGAEWAHFGVTVAVWMLLPLLIGIRRVLKSEVK